VRQRFFMILTALAAAVCIIYLQRRFDAADMKNCVAIAQTYRAPSGKTIPEVLESRHPGAPVVWSGTETSSCFQHVRVEARVAPKDAPPILYDFDIDLNGPSIHPGNPLGVEALEALDSTDPGASHER
jgi:hypothetical protein